MALSTKVSSAVRQAIRSPLAVGAVRWQSGGDDYDRDMFSRGPQSQEPSGYNDRRQQPGAGGYGHGGGFGAGGYGGGRGGGFGGGRGGGRGGGFERSFDRPARPPMPEIPLPEEGPFRLFIKNMNYDCTEQDVRTFFGDVEITDCHLPKNEFGLSRGFAFVELTTREDAQKALDDLDGMEMLGRNIGLKVAAPRPPRMEGGRGGGFGGGRGGGGGGGFGGGRGGDNEGF